ncbi:S-adenosyl-L-methionine-dependent methyltransferase [Daldinia vernicosa]|uniref:S-adenosyl-L-methionine-dependent methyltransferase n=1 Tax=Daldinia vernicosa TaxID=114800 RepID=UPI002008B193|nr:S-adenosyl-L-methionine-dependent methyltransferase [Daldinia vernicosa]KAI0851585.1 S-adenosyl-L-methionine-dependent methyltransferase [Daldinia vernicosa]
MPRLSPPAIRRLHANTPLLAALLPTCKTLNSAHNELRWIREHVWSCTLAPQFQSIAEAKGNDEKSRNALLRRLCRLRGRGYPLQYILGTQPFGRHIDIKCRPGVLIPRPETEAWTTHLAKLMRRAWKVNRHMKGEGIHAHLRILDLCTGSGCIALLLHSLLFRKFPKIRVQGLDIEPRAVSLAKENLAYNVERGLLQQQNADAISFEETDIFSADWLAPILEQVSFSLTDNPRGRLLHSERGAVDILVSNPPYISREGFDRDTERSVRNHEPRLALVPEPLADNPSYATVLPEDVFYARILDVAEILRPRFVVLEVGDLAQAVRVVQMARERNSDAEEVEIWRDWPDMQPREGEPESVDVAGMTVPVRGSGNGRVVFLRRLNLYEYENKSNRKAIQRPWNIC